MGNRKIQNTKSETDRQSAFRIPHSEMVRRLRRPLGIYIVISILLLLIKKAAFYTHFLIPFLFLYLPLFLIRIEKKNIRNFGLEFRDWRWADLGLALKVSAVILLPYSILHLFFFQGRIQTALLSPDKIVPLILAEIFLVGLPEEVFFRGYLQTHLEDIFIRRFCFLSVKFGFGMIMTAVLFALSHFLLTKQLFSLAVFFPALIFGWLKERTGRVFSPMIFHALANTVYFLIPW